MLIAWLILWPCTAQSAQGPEGIPLRTRTINPASAVSWIPDAQGKTAGAVPTGEQLFVVQLAPITNEALDALDARGLAPLQPIPGNAYLVYGDPGKLPRANTAPALAWAGPFEEREKMHAALAAFSQSLPTVPQPDETEVPIIVQFFEHEAAAATQKALGMMAQSGMRVSRAGNHHTARLSVAAKDLEAIAALPLVYNVEPQPQYALHGERQALIISSLSDPTLPGVPAPADGEYYSDFLARKGVDGSGVTVMILDDGLDRGLATNAPGSAHVDITGRIAAARNFTLDPSGSSPAGHGTLNAGIIMGQPKAGATLVDGRLIGRTDARGFQMGQGIAPGARIASAKVFRNSGAFDIGSLTFAELMQAMAPYDAAVCSNSWGAEARGAYNGDSQDFDALARDANPALEGDQPMLFCFSTGNSGRDYGEPRGSIGAPATAKNVIAVGATENSDANGTDGCFYTAADSDNAAQITPFSSRGPADDTRLGVTLVAPGTHIFGIASTIDSFDGSGICGGASNDGELPNTDAFYPPNQTDYTWSTGTSHSAPAVAGVAALFVDYYEEAFGARPSPALIKAALVNSAVPIPGDTTHPTDPAPFVPNPDVGWGRVNAGSLLPEAGQPLAAFLVDQDHVFTESGQVIEYAVTPLDTSIPLKITLSWTDVPGVPYVSPALINDLDLRVIQGGQVYLGNQFEGGQSVTGGTADRVENLECVFIPNPSGSYRIQIAAAFLAGDGVPSHEGMVDQDFALFAGGGLNDSPAGRLSLDQAIYAMNDTMKITLSDSDLRGQSQAAVSVASSTGGQINVELPILISGGGFYEGAVTLRGDAPVNEGELLVASGDTITVSYADADNGGGTPAVATALAQVDGEPPVLSSLEVIDTDWRSATIFFETDELSTAKVMAGTDCDSLEIEKTDSMVAQHRVVLSGLAPDTLYRARVRVVDQAGNAAESDCFAVRTDGQSCGPLYNQETAGEEPFTHAALQGTVDWEIIEHTYAISTRAWYIPNIGAVTDAVLVLPSQGPLLPDSLLTFWHTYAAESNYDGGVIEYSLDGGATWSDLGSRITRGGYSHALRDSLNPLAGRDAWSGGTFGTMSRVEADLSDFVGQEVDIRFRFGADNYASSTGWLVDNIRICAPAGMRAKLHADSSVYRAQQEMTLYLTDQDLAGMGQAQISVYSTSESAPESISLAETSPGQFTGAIEVTDSVAASDGRIGVGHNDVITAAYMDADDGTGLSRLAAVTATADLEGARILNSGFTDITSRGAYYTVEVDEPAQIAIKVDAGKDGRSWILQAPAPAMQWRFWLNDLTPCSIHRATITTTDAIGNGLSQTGYTKRHLFRTLDERVLLEEDSEGGPALLTHGATTGVDDWAPAVDEFAHGPVNSWQASDPPYLVDKWLRTPPIDIAPGDLLVFWHTYAFEKGTNVFYDGGVVEISVDGGTNWADMENAFLYDSAYDGIITTQFNSPIGGRRAFSGGELGEMEPVFVDLGSWAGTGRQIRFRLCADSSVGGGGWRIDDIQVLHQIECPVDNAAEQTWEKYP